MNKLAWGGQSSIARTLMRELGRGKVVHAYLWISPQDAGASQVAMSFAQALLCHAPAPGGACGRCPACGRFLSGNHPDMLHLTLGKKASIGVEEVRALIAQVQVKPYEGGRRVVVLDPADKLTPAAQNALLKTLEEPPPHAVFLLAASRAQAMLPTVLSRVQVRQLNRSPQPEIAALLRGHGYDGSRARVAAALSDGWPARALWLAQDEAWFEAREKALGQLMLLLDAGVAKAAEGAAALRKEKDASKRLQMLDFWLWMLRDIAAAQSGGACGLHHPDHEDAIKSWAVQLAPRQVLGLSRAVEQARVRLSGNAAAALTADWILSAAPAMNP